MSDLRIKNLIAQTAAEMRGHARLTLDLGDFLQLLDMIVDACTLLMTGSFSITQVTASIP
jgi:hypothetical protein